MWCEMCVCNCEAKRVCWCTRRAQRVPLRRLSCALGMSISSCYHGSLPCTEWGKEYVHVCASLSCVYAWSFLSSNWVLKKRADWCDSEAVICVNLGGRDKCTHTHTHTHTETHTHLFWVSVKKPFSELLVKAVAVSKQPVRLKQKMRNDSNKKNIREADCCLENIIQAKWHARHYKSRTMKTKKKKSVSYFISSK